MCAKFLDLPLDFAVSLKLLQMVKSIKKKKKKRRGGDMGCPLDKFAHPSPLGRLRLHLALVMDSSHFFPRTHGNFPH